MNASLGIDALEKAIKYVGSQEALAKRINSNQQTISWWLNKSGKVPAEKAIAIETATDKTVTRQQLRPDLFQISQ